MLLLRALPESPSWGHLNFPDSERRPKLLVSPEETQQESCDQQSFREDLRLRSGPGAWRQDTGCARFALP